MLLISLPFTRISGQLFVPIRRSLLFLAEKPGDKANVLALVLSPFILAFLSSLILRILGNTVVFFY